MAKMKTHSGAKKRFKKNKNGKVKAQRAGHRHLLTKKSSKLKRSMRHPDYIGASDLKRVLLLLPN